MVWLSHNRTLRKKGNGKPVRLRRPGTGTGAQRAKAREEAKAKALGTPRPQAPVVTRQQARRWTLKDNKAYAKRWKRSDDAERLAEYRAGGRLVRKVR